MLFCHQDMSQAIIAEFFISYKINFSNFCRYPFNNFKDGVESISSIHSNSVLRIFQHNAEKILDMTEQLGSEMKIEKKVRNEVV